MKASLHGILKIYSLIQDITECKISLQDSIHSLSSKEYETCMSNEIASFFEKEAQALFERDLPKALIIAEISFAMCNIIGDPRAEAHCGVTLGVMKLHSSRIHESIQLFNNSLIFYKKASEESAIGPIKANLGSAYIALHKYLAAMDYLSQAEVLFRKNKDKIGLAKVLNSLSLAAFETSKYLQSIEYNNEAIDLFTELNDCSRYVNCLTQIGLCHCYLGNYLLAIEYTLKALDISKSREFRNETMTALSNLGMIYNYMGDNAKALDSCNSALELADELKHRYIMAITYGILGNINIDFGQYKDAIEYFNNALNIFQEDNNKKGQGIYLGNLGLIYCHLREYQKAIDLYQKALQIVRDLGDIQAESVILGFLGEVYQFIHNFNEAEKYLSSAVEISNKIGDKKVMASCMIALGNNYYKLGNSVKAIEIQTKASKILHEIGALNYEQRALVAIGEIYENGLFKEDSALANYATAIELAERIRAGINVERFRMGIMNLKESAYAHFIALCTRIESSYEQKIVRSYEYLERFKCRTILEALSHTDIKPNHIIPEDLLLSEKALLKDIKYYYLNQNRQPVSSADIHALEMQLDKVWDKINVIDPEYVSLRRGKPLNHSQILSTISNQTKIICIIEYFYHTDKLIIFILRSNTFKIDIEEIAFPEELFQGYIDKYTNDFLKLRTSNSATEDLWQELSLYFIDPIKKYLDNIDIIYFVPYKHLHYLPLHLLKIDGQYIIEKYQIIYAPSASVIGYCQKKWVQDSGSCLIIGVDFEDEADKIADIYKNNSRVLKGFEATKELIEYEAKLSNIIHFSCHGFFDSRLPMKSGLKLSDSILTSEDVFRLDLHANVVTLSACETGINDHNPGDDMVGLTRGFLYAGASTVLVSLWAVAAPSTMKLMERFYLHLNSGLLKTEALQKAQLEIKEIPLYNHPYYWAPFILVGIWK